MAGHILISLILSGYLGVILHNLYFMDGVRMFSTNSFATYNINSINYLEYPYEYWL